ncbi:MAG: DUF348 domain-containing protein [Chloroflexi bacterium]|nr:DUF348 domain-containing protein [Chloroflexota bacterium]
MPGFFALTFTFALVLALAVTYVQSGDIVSLEVNGHMWRMRTHQKTVAALLREVGLALRPEDIVLPSLETRLGPEQLVTVEKALPILVDADGQVVEHYTHCRRVGDLLSELGLDAKPQDMVALDGQPVDLDAQLPLQQWTPTRWPLLQRLAGGLVGNPASSRLRVSLRRAVPLSIHDGGAELAIYTLARTVGEALLSQNIVLYFGDRVYPMLGTLLSAGVHVEIHRATPVHIQVDGRLIHTRVQARTVAQVLNETGLQLLGRDYVSPSLHSEIIPDMRLRVVRVLENWVSETENIPFETMWRSDSTLELDQTRTDQAGKAGIRKRRVRIVYEDGEQKERQVVDEWVERQPTTRVLSYGTKIVWREQDTPDGMIRYWRKVRMHATSYTAATSGKSRDHPQFGITRLGWWATKGIVAVDPLVVNLGTKVYVPGYGFATAADTGGLIKGRRIDLCYDEHNLVLWYRWVDVYLLEPIPSTSEIHWILPNYPTERR